MRHLEVHVIESQQDEADALGVGLVEDTDILLPQCFFCREAVGVDVVTATFVQYKIVLDDSDDSWFECMSCTTTGRGAGR